MKITADLKISVIILSLNAGENLNTLLDAVYGQSLPPYEVIVVDSESEDNTVAIAESYGAMVYTIKRCEFNHGGTRDYAMRQSKGDWVLFLTQDAVPSEPTLLEKMAEMLEENEQMAAVYARQIPREDATYMECLIREFNYPSESHVYCKEDIVAHGIKTFFMSDVCAMYRKHVYFKLGGFERDVKTNEDMLYAAKAIHNGYSIGYEAAASVLHSHNFSLKEQFKRNYLQGYEIERHRKILIADSQNSEGIKLVKYVSREMLSRGKLFHWIYFGFDCVARYLGSHMGKQRAAKGQSE